MAIEGGGLGRWLTLTRQVGATIRRKQKELLEIPDPEPEEPKEPPRRPGDRAGAERGLLERVPAPRGHDALHSKRKDEGPDKAWSGHQYWFGDAEKQTLAQRSAEVLAGLGPLQLPPRRVDDGQPGGLHRSLRRGGGVEFSEHKEYAPGDDLRHLDWRAYARTDRYYIKRYEQEVHATLTLVVDASASMQVNDLRGGDKFDAVRLMLAALGLVLVRQGDAVGLMVIGQPELNLAPAGGLRHFANLADRLEKLQPGGTSGLDVLGPSSWRGLERRGLVVVASDALVEPNKAMAPLRDLARSGQDVLLLHCLHPRELDLDFQGPTWLQCRETGDRRLTDPRLARAQYVEMMQAHCQQLRTLAVHGGLGYLLVDTGIEPRGVVRQILRATAQLRRRGQAPVEVGAYGDAAFDPEVVLASESSSRSSHNLTDPEVRR